LTPWDNFNHFIQAAQNVQARMKDPNEENEYQLFVNPNSFVYTSSLSNIGQKAGEILGAIGKGLMYRVLTGK
jgi:hypothetical protein